MAWFRSDYRGSDRGTDRDGRKCKAGGIDVIEPRRLVVSVDRIAVWNDIG